MNTSENIQHLLSNTLQTQNKEMDWEAVREQLVELIHELIESDFNRLLTLLYQIDVSEVKIRKALAEKEKMAGEVIADLIIERQKEKVEMRKKYKMK